MKWFVIDIETKRDTAFCLDPYVRDYYRTQLKAKDVAALRSEHEQSLKELRPAGNLKDPAKIEANLAQKRVKLAEKLREDIAKAEAAEASMFESAALSPITGRVVAIAWAPLEGENVPRVIVNDDEHACLSEWLKCFTAESGLDYGFVGFNLRDFDVPFLRYRLALHGLGTAQLQLPGSAGRYDPRVFDIVDDVLGRTHKPGKLGLHLRRFFAGDVEKIGDGSEVEGMSLGDLAAYVEQDVAATRALARRFQWAFSRRLGVE